MLKRAVATAVLSLSCLSGAGAAEWSQVERDARGQTVYFHAWGGDNALNAHLEWVAYEARSRFAIDLRHVKLADTSSAVARLIAETDARNDNNGSADLLWINGENFSALKDRALLFGPWAERQPNFALVDASRFPEMRRDFGVTTAGFESPWTRSQLIFYYDSERIDLPPRSMTELLAWAKIHPGQFTYPRPPAFLGSTFLKQALLELSPSYSSDAGDNPFSEPVNAKRFETLSAPLWAFLDELNPLLLRGGRHFPQSGAQLAAALFDRETSLAFAFNPNEVVSAISRGDLPITSKSYVLDAGTLSNVSFVAIPVNSPHKEGAQVIANFLLSAEVQFRAAINPALASEPAIAFDQFNPQQRARLLQRAQNHGAIDPRALARKLEEPHPSWTQAIEKEWQRRYGAGFTPQSTDGDNAADC